MFDSIANIKLSDLLKESPAGEPVNVHVVTVAPEPRADFEEMRRIVHGDPSPPTVLDNLGGLPSKKVRD